MAAFLRIAIIVSAGAVFFIFCCTDTTFAGEWRVAPVRLDLSAEAKTGAISVINEEAERFQTQIRAFQWTQDAEGRDQYVETGDLIFFPKMLLFDKGGEKVVRVGINSAPVTAEKTYRLFIEELPGPDRKAGSSIAIAIKFGVPIFVKPAKEETSAKIELLELVKGTARLGIRNTGNVHFIIKSIVIKGFDEKGSESWRKEMNGWYLLKGASRTHDIPLPDDLCERVKRLDVEMVSDKINLIGRLDVDKDTCKP